MERKKLKDKNPQITQMTDNSSLHDLHFRHLTAMDGGNACIEWSEYRPGRSFADYFDLGGLE